MSDKYLDRHGQPLNRLYSEKRLKDSGMDELLGFARGVLSDGKVVHGEAEGMLDWFEANPWMQKEPLARGLYMRIQGYLYDGILDKDEAKDLHALLCDFIGGPAVSAPGCSLSSKLPLDNPPPRIQIEERNYCLTGRFCYGFRRIVEEEIKNRGGWVHQSIRLDTDYLLIGVIASRDWIHTSMGRKIEKAMEYRDEKETGIAIISEEHWESCLL